MDDQQASRLRQVAYNHQEPAWFIEKRLAAQKLLLNNIDLSLIHISEPTRRLSRSRMPSSA